MIGDRWNLYPPTRSLVPSTADGVSDDGLKPTPHPTQPEMHLTVPCELHLSCN